MKLSDEERKQIKKMFDERWVIANEEEPPSSCDRAMYANYLYTWNWYLSGYKDGMVTVE